VRLSPVRRRPRKIRDSRHLVFRPPVPAGGGDTGLFRFGRESSSTFLARRDETRRAAHRKCAGPAGDPVDRVI
jgi:hypothetical protein